MKTGILLMLSFAAAEDLKRRSIPVLPVIAASLLLLCLRYGYFHQSFELQAFLAGLIPGAAFFMISAVSRGAAGSGDALILLLIGMLTGFWETGAICFLALVLTGFSGLALMAAGKAGRKSQLPFIPFILISYVLLLASGFLELL
jgi:prepilin signal peptidase PulO-like enzyme (type II secretory pathway)